MCEVHMWVTMCVFVYIISNLNFTLNSRPIFPIAHWTVLYIPPNSTNIKCNALPPSHTASPLVFPSLIIGNTHVSLTSITTLPRSHFLSIISILCIITCIILPIFTSWYSIVIVGIPLEFHGHIPLTRKVIHTFLVSCLSSLLPVLSS